MTDAAHPASAAGREQSGQKAIEDLSQGQLFRLRFRKHKLAMLGLYFIIGAFLMAGFAEFLAPHDPGKVNAAYQYAPPQMPRLVDADGNFHLRPFVYPMERSFDIATGTRTWTFDTDTRLKLTLFASGDSYVFWGLVPWDRHLFGTAEGVWYPLGTDRLGRDTLSRIMHGARVSLTVGMLGVAISLVLGVLIGGAAGYFGGWVDNVVQRLTEVAIAIPSLPLWMALSAALPTWWSPITVYFAITLILSAIGWTGMAREVRGRFLALREEEFVMAARLSNCSQWRIITRHMVPSVYSHIIASASLAIPAMILAETALSFLGIGLRAPVISWGVLMQEAQNIHSVALYPWLLLPGVFVILTVLAFNFVGDGLRDAADPHNHHV
ncbi:MAG: ABC transporter permease [Rhizobiales bacterium]|nr:ABC transporter permease [Hyphomicrobiales bacterium]MBO6699928.1 ABC transporter permease [Hyphomicrobiales bacterium]MBO6737906.1 ABC transporter permease [Hyphomicrobiales bacterium]MBO6913036.1 ABC transporter permease [Hyphomicrobiales bacterium]MBO6957333.1 ABC transporter permease [Hyphomicrobiales bacterium]